MPSARWIIRRIAEGITPAGIRHFLQQIPTFSLWYIEHGFYDYWMYRGDSSFVADKMQV